MDTAGELITLTSPGRLWRRYLIHSPMFVLRVGVQMLGLRRYPLDDDETPLA